MLYYITHDMLCYITNVMLRKGYGYITHVMLWNTSYVMLYNR